MFGDIKKRIVPSLIILTASIIPFVLWAKFLSESEGFLWIPLVGLCGVVLGIFYLMFGMKPALSLTGGVALCVLFIALPTPWNVIFFVASIIIGWILSLMRKGKAKKKLMESDPTITKVKAAEIIASGGESVTDLAIDAGGNTIAGALDEAQGFGQRITEEMLETGFLVIHNATLNNFLRPYLLSFDEEGLLLYCIEEKERAEQLTSKVLSFDREGLLYYGINQKEGLEQLTSIRDSTERNPKDVRIEYRDISHVSLALKTVLVDKGIYLTIHSRNKKRKYAVMNPSVSSKQVEKLFTTFSSIRVENKIQGDFLPTIKVTDTIRNVDYIKEADEETVRRKRASRRWRTALTVLTALLTFSLLVLGIRFRSPFPFVVMCLWPFVITGFFIAKQEDLTLGESKLGKWSVFPTYAAHFLTSSGVSWLIILEVWECTCIFRHPQFWLYGGMGTIIFFVFAWWWIREFHGGMKKKLGLALASIAFGFQIVAMLLILLHILR